MSSFSSPPFIVPPRPLPADEADEDFLRLLRMFDHFVIFSPHLDDALLSMGSLLAELATWQKPITIVNVFTQGSQVDTPNVRVQYQQSRVQSAEEYFNRRKEEDRKAFAQLDPAIEIKNLDITDGAWRTDELGQALYQRPEAHPSYQRLFVDLHPADSQTADTLKTTFSQIVGSKRTLTFSPLARGEHIDHLLVRDSLTELPIPIVYYVDFPYADKYPNEFHFIHDHQLHGVEWHGDYSDKPELLHYYETQFSNIFQPTPFKLGYERFYYSENSVKPR